MGILSIAKVFVLAAIVATAALARGSNDGEEIVFLTLSLVYDSDLQEYRMDLTDKKVVPGRLRRNAIHGHGNPSGDFGELEYQILDENSNLVNQSFLPWPLERSVEFVNEEGRLQRADVHLDTAQVVLRLQLTPQTRRVVFDAKRGRAPRGENAQPLLVIDLDR